jgi:starch phosphorylase
MKFAMNGALTIGTLDGANIEIREAVGAENMFIFGLTAEAIADLRLHQAYAPQQYYESDPALRRVLNALAGDRFCSREPGLFRWIPDVLLSRDDYFVLGDFASYVATQAQISQEYAESPRWARKAILNVARIGRFSCDRTVGEYAREIWGLSRAVSPPK